MTVGPLGPGNGPLEPEDRLSGAGPDPARPTGPGSSGPGASGPGAAGPVEPVAAGTGTPSRAGAPTGTEKPKVTRAGMVWVATATVLVLLVLLIIFIMQNQDPVQLRYFGWDGFVQLGLALLIAAVGGGILVAAAGAARIIQLRANAHRARTEQTRRRTR
jgi:uncharacterized integral membrane protein